MNAIVDQASALKGIITDQTSIATAIDPAADLVLVYDASVTALRKALVSALPGAGTVTSVALTATPTSVFSVGGSPITVSGTLALGLDAQNQNKVLAAPADGSNSQPSFRKLVPADLPETSNITALQIDWSLANTFTKTLSAITHFSAFVNATAGQTIVVRLVQGAAYTVTWTNVRWPGGTAPVMTTGAGSTDIYTFHYIGGNYYGTFDQDFQL